MKSIGAVVSIRPQQNHDAALQPRQTHPMPLAVNFASVLACEHRLVKRGIAIGQINMMFSKIRFALNRIETNLLIVYAINRDGKRQCAVDGPCVQ